VAGGGVENPIVTLCTQEPAHNEGIVHGVRRARPGANDRGHRDGPRRGHRVGSLREEIAAQLA
jgi:hypothetical protein